jgi:uncharacterized protein DUF2190
MSAKACIPLFKDGKDISGHTTAAVVGKTFADISGNIQSGPEITSVSLPETYDGGNFEVAGCEAKKRAIGVFAYDAASGVTVPIMRGSGLILPVVAGGAITAGEEVEVGAESKAVKIGSGVAVGKAYTTAASGKDCYVSLY